MIALYENATPFTFRVVQDAEGWAELESLWPIRKFPLLRDGEATIVESSIIVVLSPMQTLVSDRLRAETERDAKGVVDARKLLDVAYGWLDKTLARRAWAAGDNFSLADCSAAPALFYSDWVHPIGDRFPAVLAYRGRVLARPAVARVVEEARPYRKLFPEGAPDRD